MSSSTANAGLADSGDWQLLKTGKSYAASKHHVELLAAQLDVKDRHKIKHFVVQPGVVLTNISKGLTGPFVLLEWIQLLIFYLVRGCLNEFNSPL